MLQVYVDLEEGKNFKRQLGSILGRGRYATSEALMATVRGLLSRRGYAC
jgi:hypothetical protein